MSKTTNCVVVENGVLCDKPLGYHEGAGMCHKHRLRFLRHGDPLAHPRVNHHDQIFELHQLGLTQRQIATEVGVSQPAVAKALKRMKAAKRPPNGQNANFASDRTAYQTFCK